MERKFEIGQILLNPDGAFIRVNGFAPDGKVWARPVLGGRSECYEPEKLKPAIEEKPKPSTVQMKLF